MIVNYFDIETYSPGEFPNPKTDKIISIQFQKIDISNKKVLSKLQILKEWEDGEEEIVKLIYNWFFKRNYWNFIPVGFNLIFEWNFLFEKFKKYKLVDDSFSLLNFFKMPQIDLKSIAVLKKGEFKGASLSFISNKENDGNIIKELYENEKFDDIEDYIRNEAQSFIELLFKVSDYLKKFEINNNNS
jgi:hypothetical protein